MKHMKIKVLWLGLLLGLATVPGVASDSPTPEQVLQRHVAAMGDSSLLTEVQSVEVKTEGREGGRHLAMTIRLKAQGLAFTETMGPSGTSFTHGCGRQGSWWRQDPTGIRDLKEGSAFWLGTTMAFHLPDLLNWPAQFTRLDPVQEEQLGDRAVQVVTADWRGIARLRLVFDRETGLLCMAGPVRLDDYREVHGLLLPHGIQIGDSASLQVQEVRFNVPIEDTCFQKPVGRIILDPGSANSYQDQLNPPGTVALVRRPAPALFGRGKLVELPVYDANNPNSFQVDLRGVDVSELDLSSRFDDLLHASFDSQTRWPSTLPAGYDRDQIRELGRSPGLGMRALHERGINGRGIGIGIIDQTLLVNHVEYADRVRSYEEIHQLPDTDAQMHGPAVAAFALGRTVGVAPGAELYYIAETHGIFRPGGFDWDFGPLARSIDRLLEINSLLPADQKIRVISISVGWRPGQKGCDEADAAVARARQAGVFVISTALERTHGLAFHGLGRDPRSDPEQARSYRPGSWWAKEFAANPAALGSVKRLLIPMDSRTTAGPCGEEDYVFYPEGGWSWVVPYLAGLYALACQVNPEITPEQFWEAALRTGATIPWEHAGATYSLGSIIQPIALIDAIGARRLGQDDWGKTIGARRLGQDDWGKVIGAR
jgi:hypothetical protein